MLWAHLGKSCSLTAVMINKAETGWFFRMIVRTNRFVKNISTGEGRRRLQLFLFWCNGVRGGVIFVMSRVDLTKQGHRLERWIPIEWRSLHNAGLLAFDICMFGYHGLYNTIGEHLLRCRCREKVACFIPSMTRYTEMVFFTDRRCKESFLVIFISLYSLENWWPLKSIVWVVRCGLNLGWPLVSTIVLRWSALDGLRTANWILDGHVWASSGYLGYRWVASGCLGKRRGASYWCLCYNLHLLSVKFSKLVRWLELLL